MEPYSICPFVSAFFQHRLLKVRVGGCVRIFFLFTAELSSFLRTDPSCLSFHLTDSGVVSHSDCCELCCRERWGVNKSSVPVFSSFGCIPWRSALDRTVVLCLALGGPSKLLSTVNTAFSVPSSGAVSTAVGSVPLLLLMAIQGCEVAAWCHLHLNFCNGQ